MELWSIAELRRIMGQAHGPRVTIIQPLSGIPEQDADAGAELVKKAAIGLLEIYDTRGNRRAAPMVESLERLSHEARASSDARTIAVFCAGGLEAWYGLPVRLPQVVSVSERFLVQPLLPLLQDPDRFYLLLLSGPAFALGLGNSEDLAIMRVRDAGAARLLEPDGDLSRALRIESTPLVVVGSEIPHGLAHLCCALAKATSPLSGGRLHERARDAVQGIRAEREVRALEAAAEQDRIGRLQVDEPAAISEHAAQGEVRMLLLSRALEHDDVIDPLVETVLLHGGEVLWLDPRRLAPRRLIALLRDLPPS